MRTIRTDRARELFLSTLRTTCNVSAACRVAGIGRRSAYDWRNEDSDFAADWDEAESEAVDNLEGVAYERAMSGESDRMLEVLLKGHRPDRYVERRKTEHSGTVAMKHTMDPTQLSNDELKAIISSNA